MADAPLDTRGPSATAVQEQEPVAVDEPREMRRIYVRTADRWSWAEVLLHDASGVVVIRSDFGSWTGLWPPGNRGPGTLAAFLVGASGYQAEYLRRKMVPNGGTVKEPADATIARVRGRILRLRRDEWLTREQARTEWRLADAIDEEGFDVWLSHTRLDNCWEEQHEVPDPSWVRFFELLWEPLVLPLLRSEPPEPEAAKLRARVGDLTAEVERLNGWLARIDGGDHPCQDESTLRQWAYEARTLHRPCPD